MAKKSRNKTVAGVRRPIRSLINCYRELGLPAEFIADALRRMVEEQERELELSPRGFIDRDNDEPNDESLVDQFVNLSKEEDIRSFLRSILLQWLDYKRCVLNGHIQYHEQPGANGQRRDRLHQTRSQ